MELYVNKFQPSRVERSDGQILESRVGFVHILNYEFFDPCLFLDCFHPDRFKIIKVYFYFQGFEVQSYYELFYEDDIATFHLYFYSENLLFNFLRLYDDDYNLHKVLDEIFNGNSSFVTRNDCFDILFANASREYSDVLEPGFDPEQRGLLDDELPF